MAGFSVSDTIIINPGGSNEETNQITGFGSFILDSPLQFTHEAGEPVYLVTDSDGDGVLDGSDNCSNWYNPAQILPPWPIPADDPDCDGTSSADEVVIGTDPTEACPLTIGTHDAWPADFDMNRTINTVDVFFVLPPIYGSTTGGSNYSLRADLVPDGVINTVDVFKVLPPIYGSSCVPGGPTP